VQNKPALQSQARHPLTRGVCACYEDFVNYHLYHLKTGFEK